MELTFYRIPIDISKDVLELGATLFYFDADEKARYPVLSENYLEYRELAKRNKESYLQILVKDFPLILENDLILRIIEENQPQILALERFISRKSKYEAFYRPEWNYLSELSNAFKTNDFLPLTQIIQADLAYDPQDLSVFASSVSETLEKILRRDSVLSRMICFAYCLFREMKYEDRALLYDMLGAILFKDLGLSQNKAKDIFAKNEIYFKHPYYSLFLLKKLPFSISEQCYYLILDHHEMINGEGFPRKKTGDFFHPLCDLLKVLEWVFFEKSKISEYKRVLSGIVERSRNGDFINPSLVACLSVVLSQMSEN
jgi:hypothetical protein